MNYFSTNNFNHRVSFRDAVLNGLAPDQGLYMPEKITALSSTTLAEFPKKNFKEIALAVAHALLQDDIPVNTLQTIVDHAISFDAPLHKIDENVFALELFHGPTLAFKDFGARFMSQVLGHYAQQQSREVIILVATSGDTGSAVANGFLDVPGTRVVVLYPSGKVSDIQEKQFTTLGKNITALEVKGTFDDCQRLVKQSFLDPDLKENYFLTSANSINLARLIPQSFYYFYAWSRLARLENIVFSIPSGNFGNLTAGLLAKKMGLPVKHFVAATNINDIVPHYLSTGHYQPRASISTLSNAMDVGNPSNFTRMLSLYENKLNHLSNVVSGYSFTDEETKNAIRSVFQDKDYLLDPHGAIGYLGLRQYLKVHSGFTGVFLETAHPAKFKEVVESALGEPISIPATLQKFIARHKESIVISSEFEELKSLLRRIL